MSTHAFQAPKGTRDFHPAELAVLRHIESAWRDVSVAHGYDEIDGPTFEHLELYTVKSGPGIVSELFSFRRAGGETDYALRPEFTPTLARMVAARAGELPRPVKWFSIPRHFRAERPQRGRLREFVQWNVDLVGAEGPEIDAEMIAVAVAAMERLGLGPGQVQVRLSHRHTVSAVLRRLGVADERLPAAFDLLDRRDKLEGAVFAARAAELGLGADAVARFDQFARAAQSVADDLAGLAGAIDIPADDLAELDALRSALADLDLLEWCRFDLGIVRGLAYYTGTVFELHEAGGAERAIAGGGRYDGLVELFGGPSMPAVGFAMGDVVIRLVLDTHGLLEGGEAYLPRPDAFVITAGDDEAERRWRPLVAELRRAGLHVRHSYRATRNVGKLLGEAGRCRARAAVILGRELAEGRVAVKDLDAGTQEIVAIEELVGHLRRTTDTRSAGGVCP